MSNRFNVLPRVHRQGPRPRTRNRLPRVVEQLETRHLLTITAAPPSLVLPLEAVPNDTLDQVLDLGLLGASSPLTVDGIVGDSRARAADVDWYRFQLDRTALVELLATGPQADDPPAVVLGLYRRDAADFGDTLALRSFRPPEQAEAQGGPGGEARLVSVLAPGTYHVALSGRGNRYFHPYIAGSGLDGSTGPYRLQVTADDRDQDPEDGPTVLAVTGDAAPGLVPLVTRFAVSSPNSPERASAPLPSPVIIRIDVSGPKASDLVPALKAESILLGTTVRLVYNAGGQFGDGTDEDVLLDPMDDDGRDSGFRPRTQELQLVPSAPLRPGWYQLTLVGDDGGEDRPVLTDPSGVPLGKDADHPHGRDYTATFRVGSEGGPGPVAVADDTATLAHDLGELAPGNIVQVAGAIGDDPFYDPNDPDSPMNPAADVDLYHFRVRGPGNFALTADVFARRLGSSLDPGVSLYRRDPDSQRLIFVDGTKNNRNRTRATDVPGRRPLFTDSSLMSGLTEGDYYVAVSSDLNTPMPVKDLGPGRDGLFDPNVSHSGQLGFSTGLYVLNLLIQPDDTPPRVTSTSPEAGAVLTAPPTGLIVRFNEPTNLQRLAFLAAFEQPTLDVVPAVSVEGPDGRRYLPRLESYDEATGEARFLMLDGLADGQYVLRLSGALGLTDWAGLPVVGGEGDGDYLVPFTVFSPPRGIVGKFHTGSAQEPTGDLAGHQDLGILFPNQLQAGITITRDSTPAGTTRPEDSSDRYRFQVIAAGRGSFRLSGTDLPGEVALTLTDADGVAIALHTSSDDRSLIGQSDLNPGTYLLHLGDWPAEHAARVGYQLRIELSNTPGNPPPLVRGPAPAVQIRLARGLSPSASGATITTEVSTTPNDLPQFAADNPILEVFIPEVSRTGDPPLSSPVDPSPSSPTPVASLPDIPITLVSGTGREIVQVPFEPVGPVSSPLAPAGPLGSPSVQTGAQAIASSPGAGSLLPAGTLVELAVGPMGGTGGTSPSGTTSLAAQPEVRVAESPRLLVAVVAQLPFFLPPPSPGDGGAQAGSKRPARKEKGDKPSDTQQAETSTESPDAAASSAAGERAPRQDVPGPRPSPAPIPAALLALLSDGPGPPLASGYEATEDDPVNTQGPLPAPTDEVLEAEDGGRSFFLELGLWCVALVGLGLMVRSYRRTRDAPSLTAGYPGEEGREWAGGIA